jgi:acetylornithine aminotransferase
MSYLRDALTGVAHVNEVRGRGCLFGVDLTIPGRALVGQMREQGVFGTVSAENVLRFAPAFNIPWDVLEAGLQVVARTIKNAAVEPARAQVQTT